MEENNSDIYYPTIGRRIKAMLIDSVIFTTVITVLWPTVASFGIDTHWIRIILMILPFFILDPVLVSYSGGSIGHHIYKIKVQHSQNKNNINILLAIIRFVLKTFLGLISFLMILFTRRHQAIHDYFAKSVVILKNPDLHLSIEALPERVLKENNYIYPSIIRRLIVILVYSFIVLIIVSFGSGFFITEQCVFEDKCSNKDELIQSCFGLFMIIAWIIVIITGFKSRLWGCRKKQIIECETEQNKANSADAKSRAAD